MATPQAKLRRLARQKYGRDYFRHLCEYAEGNLSECGLEEYPVVCSWCGLPVPAHGPQGQPLRDWIISYCYDGLKEAGQYAEREGAEQGNIYGKTIARHIRYFLEGIERDLDAGKPEAEQALIAKYNSNFGPRYLQELSLTGKDEMPITESG